MKLKPFKQVTEGLEGRGSSGSSYVSSQVIDAIKSPRRIKSKGKLKFSDPQARRELDSITERPF